MVDVHDRAPGVHRRMAVLAMRAPCAVVDPDDDVRHVGMCPLADRCRPTRGPGAVPEAPVEALALLTGRRQEEPLPLPSKPRRPCLRRAVERGALRIAQ